MNKVKFKKLMESLAKEGLAVKKYLSDEEAKELSNKDGETVYFETKRVYNEIVTRHFVYELSERYDELIKAVKIKKLRRLALIGYIIAAIGLICAALLAVIIALSL